MTSSPVTPASVFALPPPSTSRFVLLAMALGAFALFTGSWVVLRSGSDSLDLGCTAAVDVVACTDPGILGRGLAVLGAPIMLGALTMIVFRLLLVVRSQRLVPLPTENRTRPTLARLTAEAGLDRAPAWFRRRGDLGTSAWTLPDRIVLGGGLLAGLTASVGATAIAAEAVVAHELAHLRNRDVKRTYAVLAGSTVAAGAAIGLLVDAVARSPAVGAALATRTACLALLILLTLLAVLRAREHDADLRVAVVNPAGMADVLATARAPRGARLRWLRSHPSAAHRLDVLADPADRLRLSAAECLTTGLAAGLSITELGPVLDRLLVGLGVGPLPAYLIAGFAVGVPLLAVVGMGCARTALGPRRPARELVMAAMALGLGLSGGSELSLRSAARWPVQFASADDRDVRPSLLTADPAAALWLTALAIGGSLLLLGWASAAGRAWVAADRELRWRPALLVAGLIAAAPLGGWFLAARLAATGWDLPLLGAALSGPVGVTVLGIPIVAAGFVLHRLRRRAGRRGRIGRTVLAGGAALLALAAPGVAHSEPTAGPPPPRTQQAGIACVWLRANDVLTRPREDQYLREIGRYLVGADQPGLSALGRRLATADGHPDRIGQVNLEITRWCETWLNPGPEGNR